MLSWCNRALALLAYRAGSGRRLSCDSPRAEEGSKYAVTSERDCMHSWHGIIFEARKRHVKRDSDA